MIYNPFIKRFLDFTISLIGIIILSPLIVFIVIVLIITIRGNPFFIQLRPGKNENLFYVIKFKTMTDVRDETGKLLPDELRLTKTGSIIRKTSLDELPQLFNVIKGEMSLVGPRPLLVEYLPLYNSFQKRRHLVKPGITGWAQINGRNAITWFQKFDYDIWYVENISFLLDCKIIYKTISATLRSKGISSGTSLTMEKFEGN